MNRDNPIYNLYTLFYNVPHDQVMNINFDNGITVICLNKVSQVYDSMGSYGMPITNHI